jgi:hypothetical protein
MRVEIGWSASLRGTVDYEIDDEEFKDWLVETDRATEDELDAVYAEALADREWFVIGEYLSRNCAVSDDWMQLVDLDDAAGGGDALEFEYVNRPEVTP